MKNPEHIDYQYSGSLILWHRLNDRTYLIIYHLNDLPPPNLRNYLIFRGILYRPYPFTLARFISFFDTFLPQFFLWKNLSNKCDRGDYNHQSDVGLKNN